MAQPDHAWSYDPDLLAMMCVCGASIPADGPDTWAWVETRMRSHLRWPDGEAHLPDPGYKAPRRPSILTRLHEAHRTIDLFANTDQARVAADQRVERMGRVLSDVLAHVGVTYENGEHDPLWRRAFEAVSAGGPYYEEKHYEQEMRRLRDRNHLLSRSNGSLLNENARLSAAHHPMPQEPAA